jgi:hypothetical protein
VVVIDSSLASAGVVLGTSLKVFAVKDSVVKETLVAPPPIDFQRKACSMINGRRWVAVKVVRDRRPVADAKWDIGQAFGSPEEVVAASGITGADGMFGFCDKYTPEREFDIRARDNSILAQPVVVKVQGVLKDLFIELPPRGAP